MVLADRKHCESECFPDTDVAGRRACVRTAIVPASRAGLTEDASPGVTPTDHFLPSRGDCSVTRPAQTVPALASSRPIPNRRRLFLAALTGSGMLSGIYFAFPPIFAEAEFAQKPLVEPPPHMRTASLDSQSLPDIPLTPSIEAHRSSIKLLEDGVRRLRTVTGYTVDFTKQEVVSGRLTDLQTTRMKLRHEPFSVYMKWTHGNQGQEVLYVEGQNDGEMIVRPAGLKGRILGAIKLDPNGAMAMSESRHPITEVGLLRLAEKILDYRYSEAGWKSGYECFEDTGEVDGRPCRRFTIVYESPQLRPEYRKSVIWIDNEFSIVSKIKNYGWTDEQLTGKQLDEETLLESYTYENINLDTQLAAIDFNAANEAYGLKRR